MGRLPPLKGMDVLAFLSNTRLFFMKTEDEVTEMMSSNAELIYRCCEMMSIGIMTDGNFELRLMLSHGL